MKSSPHFSLRAIIIGLSAPTFLGLAPIFGKMAINGGAEAFTVAALRTALAVVFLWVAYFLFFRKYIYIYPAGLFGCVMIGIVNGLGSLFYYSGLGRLDASLAQLLNGMYLFFVVVLAHIGGTRLSRRLQIRVALALLALIIITSTGHKSVDGLGVGLMLANALMFGGTVIMSQFVLHEVPAPTVTLYSLTTMCLLVVAVWLAVGKPLPTANLGHTLVPIVALGITTALSRLALFAGVKFLGGLQQAVLSLTEIGVTLLLAFFLLGDRFSLAQVVGIALLMSSIILIRPRDLKPVQFNPNSIAIAMPALHWQWIAFSHAFGHKHMTDETTLTTDEMLAIQRMMGVGKGGVSPMSVNWRPDDDDPPPPAI